MSITPQYLEELKSRLSIADVIGRRVEWDKRKTNGAKGDYWACCPFHGEKSPSFHVEDRKGFFYCFGCHEKGDAIGFSMKMDNLAFHEAVEMLAGVAGMPLPERDPQAAKKREERNGLIDHMEAAQRFYRAQLSSAAARDAREYLERRGLSAKTLETFGIGFAPRGPNALGETLIQGGAKQAELVEAGLVGLRDDGSTYDRFRERIMFPIRNPQGQVIAFGGRAMREDAQAKYLNSSETPLFSKGRVLYNHGAARSEAGKGHPLIVCEGYMDVIALAQAGFACAVAPLGTALTEDQLDLCWRMSDEPVLAMDGDKAGLRAADRVARLALPKLSPGKTLRFALMPEGKDPDDMVKTGGASAMQLLIDKAEPLSEMIWRSEIEGQSFDQPERRAKLNDSIRSVLGTISNVEIRNYYIEHFKEKRAALFAPAKSANTPFRPNTPWNATIRPSGPTNETRRSRLAAEGAHHARQALESEILRLAMGAPDGMETAVDALSDVTFANPLLDMIRGRLISAYLDLSTMDVHLTTNALIAKARTGISSQGNERIDHIASGIDDTCTETGLLAAVERHRCILAVESEKPDRDSDFAVSDDDVAYRRMLEARQAREEARQTNLYPADEDENVSVQDFIDQKIWIKTSRSRQQ
jgi:DNA primase